MNGITFFILVSIAYQYAATTPDYEYLTNRSIEGAKLLVKARERFAEIRSMNSCSVRWDSSLEDKSNYTYRELNYICHHMAYLDMLSAANTSNGLTPESAAYYSVNVTQYKTNSHEDFCKNWVSEPF